MDKLIIAMGVEVIIAFASLIILLWVTIVLHIKREKDRDEVFKRILAQKPQTLEEAIKLDKKKRGKK